METEASQGLEGNARLSIYLFAVIATIAVQHVYTAETYAFLFSVAVRPSLRPKIFHPEIFGPPKFSNHLIKAGAPRSGRSRAPASIKC